MKSVPAYQRILLKISGEVLAGPKGFGLDIDALNYVCEQIKSVHAFNIETAIVVGGGNFMRGEGLSVSAGIDRTVADQMGMLGTLSNALALQSLLEQQKIPTRVQSALSIASVAENFIRRRAIRHLEKKRVVVFAAGTGNPYFTTDTAAVLRALEVEANCLIKATKVDGIYDKDPNKFPTAKKYESLTYEEAIFQNLEVMDQTAFTLCRENQLPLIVLNLFTDQSIIKAILGEKIGTLVGKPHV